MSVKIGVLNGSNFNRDVDFQSGLSNLLTEGVRKNFMNELEVTENQVDTGMCFIEVTRDAVTPSETFLIPVVVTTQQVISTAGNGYVIVRIEKDKVNDGGDIDADGENVATVEVVTTLPVSDYYIILATLSSSVITDARAWSQLNDDAIEDPVYYDEDEGSTDSYVISINGVKEYIDGKDYTFKAATTNTGASTLNINGLGAKAITKGYNSPTNDGDIIANQIVTVRFNSDSNSMQMVSPPSGTLLLEKASQAQAVAGTDDNTYMTPLKTFNAIGTRLLTAGGSIVAGKGVKFNSAGKVIDIPKTTLVEKRLWQKFYSSEDSGSKSASTLAWKFKDIIFFVHTMNDSGGNSTKDVVAFKESKDGVCEFFGYESDKYDREAAAYFFNYLYRIGGDDDTLHDVAVDEDSGCWWHSLSELNRDGNLGVVRYSMDELTQKVGVVGVAAYPFVSNISNARIERTSVANTIIAVVKRTGGFTNEYQVITGSTPVAKTPQAYPSTLGTTISHGYDSLLGYPVFMSGGIARVATAVEPVGGTVTWGDASDTIASVTNQGGISFNPDENYFLFTYTKSSVLKGRLGRITGGKIVWAGTEQTIINANVSTGNGNVTYSKAHGGWIVAVNNYAALVMISSGDLAIFSMTVNADGLTNALVVASSYYPENIYTCHVGDDIVYYKASKYLGTGMGDFMGIAQESGSLDQTKNVAVVGGISNVHTGLIPGSKFYYAGAEVGRVISATQVKLYDKIL